MGQCFFAWIGVTGQHKFSVGHNCVRICAKNRPVKNTDLWSSKVQSVQFGRSVMSDSLLPHGLQHASLCCPWGFFSQGYWSGLPCPPPGDLPDPEIESRSPALEAHSLPSEPPGKSQLFFLNMSPVGKQLTASSLWHSECYVPCLV